MKGSFFRGLPQVSDDTNAGLAAHITLQELHAKLKPLSLQDGEKPGIEGLLAEFYKSFWDAIQIFFPSVPYRNRSYLIRTFAKETASKP